jgi:hypothetical protein
MVDNIDTIKAYYIPREDICSMYREADDKKREDICKLALRIEEALGNKLFVFQRMCQTNYMKYHDNWFTTTRYTQIKPFLIYDDWIVRFERVCERILVLKMLLTIKLYLLKQIRVLLILKSPMLEIILD